jgi:ACS family D-galactonate transporter-like MFS transporter
VESTDRDSGVRWTMLVLICLGFIQLTLNWFDIASAFPNLGQSMHLQIAELSLLVSLFFAGYGIFHIPTGFLAARFGLRRIALTGMLIESLGGVATGLAPNYAWLEVFRVLTGLGGSLFVGCGFALVVSWFRGKEIALAQGLSGGVCFALGAAIGLFPWVGVIFLLGWRGAMIAGGTIGLAIWLANLIWLRTPREEQSLLQAGNLNWSSVGRVLRNRNLWYFGLCTLGAAGGYFVASELMAGYAASKFHLSPAISGLMSAVIVLAGVPASLISGYWSDRARRLRYMIIGPCVVAGVAFLILPSSSLVFTWILAAFIGGSLFYFPPFTALPGHYRDEISPQDVATAEGLLLTIIAIGEFLVPIGFGQVVAGNGYGAGWIYLGIVSIVFVVFGLLAREPVRHPLRAAAQTPEVPAS